MVNSCLLFLGICCNWSLCEVYTMRPARSNQISSPWMTACPSLSGFPGCPSHLDGVPALRVGCYPAAASMQKAPRGPRLPETYGDSWWRRCSLDPQGAIRWLQHTGISLCSMSMGALWPICRTDAPAATPICMRPRPTLDAARYYCVLNYP